MGKKNKAAIKLKILPQDMEENILMRVPVKTILRFRSVCKPWYSLFLDPRFNTIHQKNNPSNSNPLLLAHRHKGKDLVVTDTSSVVLSSLDVNHRYNYHNDQGSFFLYCNGIVCVQGMRPCFLDGICSEYICLWNPALRVRKNIKIPGGGSIDTYYEALWGFGFHTHSNDYKVLRYGKEPFPSSARKKTVPFAYPERKRTVQIYSLSLDSWRTVEAAPRNFNDSHIAIRTRASGVYVNETHHWVVPEDKARWDSNAVIISFDMRDEVFKDVIVPTEISMNSGTGMDMILFNYNESLAMLTVDSRFYHQLLCNFHDVWVMKDYGLPESWTKLCKIDIPQMEVFRGFIHIENELIFSRLVGRDAQERPIVFDIDKHKVNYASSTANIEVLEDAIEVTTFTESLSLLNSKNLDRC